MKKNKIYTVHMYRFGDRERHSYTIYAGFSKSKASEAGLHEEMLRGGNKYKAEVLEFTPDKPKTKKVIVKIDS